VKPQRDGYSSRIGSRLARTHRPRLALALGILLLVAAGVLLLVSRGGDDEVQIVNGAPETGFPLRGDGARDEAMIRSAADAWVRAARRDDERWAEGDGPEVTVLWAGRVADDRDGVVLAANQRATFLHRLRGRDYWQRSAAVVEDDDDPMIVASSEAVLVRAGAESSFRPATPGGGGAPEVREDDGLWHRGGIALSMGTVLVPDGLQRRYDDRQTERPPVAVFTGAEAGGSGRIPALRELSPTLFRRLSSGPDAAVSEGAQRLNAAASFPFDQDSDDDREPQRPDALPTLDVVADQQLPPLGPVVVLSSTNSSLGSGRSRRARLVAAAGGTMVAGGDAVAVAIPLDGAQSAWRGAAGPALGAAYVRRDTYPRDDTRGADEEPTRVDGPFLLVAGDGRVARVEVRAGRRSVDIDGAVGLVPAPWAKEPGTRKASDTDVAVLGEEANGTLVVPSAPASTAVVVRFEE